MKNKTVTLVECAVMIGLSTVLSMIKLFYMPLGGSVTLLSMLPVVYVSFKYGLKWGIGTAFIYSVIQLILGLNNLSYIPTPLGVFGCIVLDYILPFTFLGLASVTMIVKHKTVKKTIALIVAGTALVVVLRFLCHFIGGAVVWYSITKDGAWNETVFKYGMWTYSFVYNISYLGPDGLLVIIASPIIYKLKKISFSR